jgi:hypothetical protein
MSEITTREEWLRWGVAELAPRFAEGGYPLPPVHVSVGFPSSGGRSAKRRVIGECWNGSASADGKAHIFISPVLVTGADALDTLVHELCHAVTPGAKHNAPFVRAGRAVGLTAGKPTSLGAGPELRAVLERLNADSPYPHAALKAGCGPTKTQSTRMIKMVCPDCGYTARTTRKWLETVGPAVCPLHEQMEIAA